MSHFTELSFKEFQPFVLQVGPCKNPSHPAGLTMQLWLQPNKRAFHISLIFAAGEKNKQKNPMDSLISCSDTKSFHRILLLPLLFYQVQDSRFSNPDTPSCYKPTLVSHFTTLPPSLWSTQLVSRPHLAQTTPTVFIQANH